MMNQSISLQNSRLIEMGAANEHAGFTDKPRRPSVVIALVITVTDVEVNRFSDAGMAAQGLRNLCALDRTPQPST
jgi:hypothetical protein